MSPSTFSRGPPLAAERLIPYVYIQRTNGVRLFMQRLVLAIAVVAILAAVFAMALKALAKASERRGGVDALTTGGAMQKAAFFLLLCLILYVSVSGAS